MNKKMNKEERCGDSGTIAVCMICASILILFVALVFSITFPNYNPSVSMRPNYNHSSSGTVSMNSDSGILTVNLTFSDAYKYDNGGFITISYTNYHINSATEELPNGTTITPAISYVQKELNIDKNVCSSLDYPIQENIWVTFKC